jgi:peptidoglycan/LPS O-acetylase OafA/YrhL
MGLIRFILAIGVVFSHAGMAFGFTSLGGSVAVQAFFIISGFYIALILNEKYIEQNNSYQLFISNRFLRIYPIYWVVFILTLLSAFLFSMLGSQQYFISYSMFEKYGDGMTIGTFLIMIFTNIFVFFQDTFMFLGFDATDGSLIFTSNFKLSSPKLHHFLFIAQAWSIAIEVMFYLIAPFIARKKTQTILLFILCSLGLRLMLYYSFNLQHDPWTSRFFPTELIFFLLGILAYRIYDKIKHRKFNIVFLRSTFIAVIILSLFYRYLPIPAKSMVYFAVFFGALPFIFILSKNWKTDRQIGELSYPIYISHIFVLSWVGVFQLPSKSWRTIIVIALSIVFAYVLNKIVGEKIEKIRQNRIKK